MFVKVPLQTQNLFAVTVFRYAFALEFGKCGARHRITVCTENINWLGAEKLMNVHVVCM